MLSHEREEYLQLSLAEVLDDVDSSLSTLKARDRRLAELEDKATEEELVALQAEVEEALSKATHACSGSPLPK